MKTRIRILIFVIALVVTLGVAPQTCRATPTLIRYSENPDNFLLMIKGGPINSNFTIELTLGTDWRALVKVEETAGGFGGSDAVRIRGEAIHLAGPHGEAPNMNRFAFDFNVDAKDFAAGRTLRPDQPGIVGHGPHFDQFLGTFSFVVEKSFAGSDITEYIFKLTGNHTLTDQPMPEPATLFLLGTGLAGVMKMRKRLKNRKSGQEP